MLPNALRSIVSAFLSLASDGQGHRGARRHQAPPGHYDSGNQPACQLVKDDVSIGQLCWMGTHGELVEIQVLGKFDGHVGAGGVHEIGMLGGWVLETHDRNTTATRYWIVAIIAGSFQLLLRVHIQLQVHHCTGGEHIAARCLCQVTAAATTMWLALPPVCRTSGYHESCNISG